MKAYAFNVQLKTDLITSKFIIASLYYIRILSLTKS